MTAKINFDTDNVEFERLEPTDPIDKTFQSSDNEFTDYYQIQSQYDLQEGLARTYLLKIDDRVVGYVSLAMAHLRKESTEQTQAKESDGNIPALLISHLSAHKDHPREGIGTRLVDESLRFATKYSEYIGCRYLMLNPRDDDGVRKFYESYGFTYISNEKDDKERDAFILDIKQEKKSTD